MEDLHLFGKSEIPGKNALSIFKKFQPEMKLFSIGQKSKLGTRVKSLVELSLSQVTGFQQTNWKKVKNPKGKSLTHGEKWGVGVLHLG